MHPHKNTLKHESAGARANAGATPQDIQADFSPADNPTVSEVPIILIVLQTHPIFLWCEMC